MTRTQKSLTASNKASPSSSRPLSTKPLFIRFPDGKVIRGHESDADKGDEKSVMFFGVRPVKCRSMGSKYSDALTSFFGQPIFLVRRNQGENSLDDKEITLISVASVERLGQVEESAGDARRYRMNLEIEGVEVSSSSLTHSLHSLSFSLSLPPIHLGSYGGHLG